MSDKYKETKEFICTACGKTIILTKFASQKTCRCDECKELNRDINPDIVAQALSKNPPKEKKQSNGEMTKSRPCIKCGTITEVSKFMSDKKVLCDTCKGVEIKKVNVKVDKSKIINMKLAPIEEYEVNDGFIANKNLRKVKCPSCGHEYMKIINIIDWSQFGLIISYQCYECLTKIELSEQCRTKMKLHKPSQRFDYTGTQIKDLGLSSKDSSRIANALSVLINICEENNIKIDGVIDKSKFPPYMYKNNMPVPKGFVIPDVDMWINTIDTAYNELKDINPQLAEELKLLLKGEEEEDVK